jgi:hypothetical protein
MHFTRTTTLSAAVCTALLLSACASTKMDAQWSNPEFAKASLRGQTILVACQARDFTIQAVCEDQAATQLESRGAKAVRFAVVSPGAPPANEAIEAAAKRTGARAIYRSSLSTFAPAVSSGPTIGIGVGGYGGSGGWGGGGYRGGGVGGGITLPIGGGAVSEAWAADTALVDVASGVLIWSGRATTPTGSDVTAQLTELSRVTVEALASNGAF